MTTTADAVGFTAKSAGTGPFVFGSARASFRTLAQAQAAGDLTDGQVVSYLAQDSATAPTQRAWSNQGVYQASTNSIIRSASEHWVNNNGTTGTGLLAFAVVPIVSLTLLAEDIAALPSRTIYVSPTGSDSNNGLSSSAPWKTISKVNSSSFDPGDVILFQGGQTFSGSILSPSSGTASLPIVFGSYGGGRATISSGNSNGFTSTNQPGIVVRDLIFTGTASTNKGIYFNNTLSGNVHLQNIQIINCSVSGYGQSGIHVDGNNGSSGYDDILIEGCISFNNCTVGVNSFALGTSGIQVANNAGYGLATHAPSYNNVKIINCVAHDNVGCTDVNESGNGIFVAECNQALIDGCTAFNNGSGSNSTGVGGGGPCGIWTADSQYVTIQNCVAYGQSTANNEDGNGFDLDGGTRNCSILNCYSRENFGCGYLLFSDTNAFLTASDSNVVSNCVSDHDGDGVNGTVNTGILIDAQSTNNTNQTNLRIAGCRVYNTGGGVDCLQFRGLSANNVTGHILNNTFINANDIAANQNFIHTKGNNPSSVVFEGNQYLSAGAFSINWNSTVYNSLFDWFLATGQEVRSVANTQALNVGGNLVAGSAFASYAPAHLPQLIVGSFTGTGQTVAPSFLINGNNENNIYGMGPATNGGSGADCRFWFGQALNVNAAWDTSTAAGHVAHWEIFNGALGLGSGGTVDCYFGRSGVNTVTFGTTTALGSPGNTTLILGTVSFNSLASITSPAASQLEFLVGGVNKLDYGVTSAGIWSSAVQIEAPTFNVNTNASIAAPAASQLEFLVGGVNKLDYGVTSAGIWSSAVQIEAPTFNVNSNATILAPAASQYEVQVGGVNKLDYGVTTSGIWTSAVQIEAPTFNVNNHATLQATNANNFQILVNGNNKLDFGISSAGIWSTPALVGLNLGTGPTGSSVPAQLFILDFSSSGSAIPQLLLNANNTQNSFAFGPGDLAANSGVCWFGQSGGASWDTSTAAGHLAHFEIFNGTLGLGQGGTVDAFFGRTSANTVTLGTTTSLGTKASLIVSDLFTNDASFLIRTQTSLTNSAAAQTATLTNAPTAGNPTKWVSVDDNGTTRRLPLW